jgi:hypothetical protein
VITIEDLVGKRKGTVLSYDGITATVQWEDHWVTGVTKSKLESGRYCLASS